MHPKYVQHLAGHASIQLTLDRYSHWMPTMGKPTIEQTLNESGEVLVEAVVGEEVVGAQKVQATPAAKRTAEELGVDLSTVEGTGSGGRITVRDVRSTAQ